MYKQIIESMNNERQFGSSEIFFSTTDRKGIIRSGNRVFIRVSGYTRAELLGSPHNIIRHPDMPRVLFKIMWDTIEGSKPFAGYIKNRAKDGCYYWVLAILLPGADGYLAVRIKPTTALFETAQALYPALLAREQEVEAGDPHQRKQSMAASAALLAEQITAAGVASYEQFMHAALFAEVHARAVQARPEATCAPASGSLAVIQQASTEIHAFLQHLIIDFDRYATVNAQLAERTVFMLSLSHDVANLTERVETARLRGHDPTIEMLCGLLAGYTASRDTNLDDVRADLTASVGLIDSMLFPVAATTIESEVLQAFVQELRIEPENLATMGDDLRLLTDCVMLAIDSLATTLSNLQTRLHSLGNGITHLRRGLLRLRTLDPRDASAAPLSPSMADVLPLLTSLAHRIEHAEGEMAELGHLATFGFQNAIGEARRCRHLSHQISHEVDMLLPPPPFILHHMTLRRAIAPLF